MSKGKTMIKRNVSVILLISMFVHQSHAMDSAVQSKLGAWKTGESLKHLSLELVTKKMRELKKNDGTGFEAYCASLDKICAEKEEYTKGVRDLIMSQARWVAALSSEKGRFSTLYRLAATQPIDVNKPGERDSLFAGEKLYIYALAEAS